MKIDVGKVYESYCAEWGIPFTHIDTVRSYNDSTLFCPAGMQQYKEQFQDKTIRDVTVANIQPCIRMNDFAEIGDSTHLLHFNMIGLFSFRDLSVQLAIQFFMGYLKELGLKPSFVTVHPDKNWWSYWYKDYDVTVLADKECKWSDGGEEAYCTEFYINGIEVGNIVNPRIKHTMEDGTVFEGNCIDVGFGLERLDSIVNGTPPPTKEEKVKQTIQAILDSGYQPGPKKQGYVLRKLIRELYNMKVQWDHPVYLKECVRQDKLKEMFSKIKDRHTDKSAEWWYDTHGIIVSEM